MGVMLDDDEAIGAAVGRTNRHLKRMWILSGISFAVILLVAGVLALVRFANNPHGDIDHAALVSNIHTWAVDKEHADPSIKVQCPDDIPIKAGSTFHCLLSARGQTVRLVVTIENDKGYMTWTTG